MDINDFFSVKTPKEKSFERKERLITESYGSFSGQFDSVKRVVSWILKYRKSGKYKFAENIENVGKVYFDIEYIIDDKTDYSVRALTHEEEGKTIVSVKIVDNPNFVVYRELFSTIAHEIMHCFQNTLPKLKGVNNKSKLLYPNLLQFYQNAPSIFSEYFFYGLYMCFSLEVNANVSSVSNYVEACLKFDKNLKFTTYETLLEKNEIYNAYKTILALFSNKTHSDFSQTDVKYIEKSMTSPMKNVFTGTYENMFDSENFDVFSFIDKNIKNIVSVCNKTIQKMHKNIINYIDLEKR